MLNARFCMQETFITNLIYLFYLMYVADPLFEF